MNVNMNNILLINPAGWQKESINLGLSLLAGSLKQAKFKVLILDLNRYEMSDYQLIKRVRKFSPIGIGISAKTATANESGRLANILHKAYPQAHYFRGGHHITLCACDFMKEFSVFKYGVMSEAEESIIELCKAIKNNKPAKALDNIAWRNKGKIIINPWQPPKNLDKLPLPDLDVIQNFKWKNFRYPILTSRGCPFNCIYCCVNKLTGSRKWRFRSAENVTDELEYVAQTKKIRSFEIWDDNFTLNIERAKEICTEIIKRKLNLTWYCHNGIRADCIDVKLARLMKKAGCTSVAFGIETGNPETFDSIKKGESLSDVLKAIKIVKKVGIQAVGYFIIGLPGDNLKKFINTVRFQRALKLDHYIYGMLVPYPKTKVWDMIQTRGQLFCDITKTQHFSDDMVPVSFELPEFPRQDMIKAFYITKYFELFETTEKIIRNKKIPHVFYLPSPELNKFLPGMLIASNNKTKHIIFSKNKKIKSLLQTSSAFSQVPENIDIAFTKSLKNPALEKDNYILVGEQHGITKYLFFCNIKIFIFDPFNPLNSLHFVKKNIKKKRKVLGIHNILNVLISLHRFIKIPHLRNTAGVGKGIIHQVLLYKIKYILLFIMQIIKHMLILAIHRTKYITLKSKIILYMFLKIFFYLWSCINFMLTKQRIRKISPNKEKFPYDDYSTYL